MMSASPAPLVYATNSRLHGLNEYPSTNDSPIAVRNRIKAIQSRKARLTVPTYYDSTEIRPLNINGVTNSSTNFSVITAERLVDRSKDYRLDRNGTRLTSRPSIGSNSSLHQQSFLWTNLNSLNSHSRNFSATTTQVRSRSSIAQPNETNVTHRRRQTSNEHRTQISPMTNDSRVKSTIKSKSSVNPNQQSLIDNKEQNVELIDEQFQEYLERANAKCADWLMKYVFVESSTTEK